MLCDNPIKITDNGTKIAHTTPNQPIAPTSCGFPAAFAKEANIAPPPAVAVNIPNSFGPLSKTPCAIIGNVSNRPRPTIVTKMVSPKIYNINGSFFV